MDNGVELNSMYFNQNYTAVDSKYGSMVTILAPVSDQILEVQKGMTGSTDGTWLQSVEDLKSIIRNITMNIFPVKESL